MLQVPAQTRWRANVRLLAISELGHGHATPESRGAAPAPARAARFPDTPRRRRRGSRGRSRGRAARGGRALAGRSPAVGRRQAGRPGRPGRPGRQARPGQARPTRAPAATAARQQPSSSPAAAPAPAMRRGNAATCRGANPDPKRDPNGTSVDAAARGEGLSKDPRRPRDPDACRCRCRRRWRRGRSWCAAAAAAAAAATALLRCVVDRSGPVLEIDRRWYGRRCLAGARTLAGGALRCLRGILVRRGAVRPAGPALTGQTDRTDRQTGQDRQVGQARPGQARPRTSHVARRPSPVRHPRAAWPCPAGQPGPACSCSCSCLLLLAPASPSLALARPRSPSRPRPLLIPFRAGCARHPHAATASRRRRLRDWHATGLAPRRRGLACGPSAGLPRPAAARPRAKALWGPVRGCAALRRALRLPLRLALPVAPARPCLPRPCPPPPPALELPKLKPERPRPSPSLRPSPPPGLSCPPPPGAAVPPCPRLQQLCALPPCRLSPVVALDTAAVEPGWRCRYIVRYLFLSGPSMLSQKPSPRFLCVRERSRLAPPLRLPLWPYPLALPSSTSPSSSSTTAAAVSQGERYTRNPISTSFLVDRSYRK